LRLQGVLLIRHSMAITYRKEKAMTYQQTFIPKKTNHLLHLILTIITFGMWSPIWLIVAIVNMATKDTITTLSNAPQPVLYAQGQYPGTMRMANPAQLSVGPAWADHNYDPRFYFDGQRWCSTHSTWETSLPSPSQEA
jgi:Na+-transporting NADH:ubiquinone oxidoreductase subunit NqrC